MIGTLIAALERPPLGALYRVAIGFMFFPACAAIFGRRQTLFEIGACFLALLVLLRVVPAVARRVLPFSSEVKTFWKEQRQLAKKYDSFQWQKLFWLGLGLLGYLLSIRDFRYPQLTFALAIITAGALGLIFWVCVPRTSEVAK